MKFHEYKTSHMQFVANRRVDRNMTHTQFAELNRRKLGVEPYASDTAALQRLCEVYVETRWVDARRPYYSVYPLAVKSLLKLKLDIESTCLKSPLPNLLVRFPEGHELRGIVKSFLVEKADVAIRSEGWGNIKTGFAFYIDAGETSHFLNGATAYEKQPFAFQMEAGKTIEEQLEPMRIHAELKNHPERLLAYIDAVRVFCTLCLLHDDPDIIKPDVLNEDARRYDESNDQKYVERAHKRGKVGWVIGSDWDREGVSPHYRRPHLGIRWTEKGRSVPKIVNISGSIVRGKRLSDVPTGYLDDDEAKAAERAEK